MRSKLLVRKWCWQVLHRVGATKPILKMLQDAGVEFEIYDKILPNPTIQQVSTYGMFSQQSKQMR